MSWYGFRIKIKNNIENFKKKQNELKEKEDLKKLNEASLILTKKKKMMIVNQKDYIIQILNIIMIYWELKQKLIEDLLEFIQDIKICLIDLIQKEELKKQKFKIDKNEKQILKIYKTNNAQRQIFGFLFYIRKRLDVLQYVSEKIIEEQIKAFKDKEEFYEDNNTIKAYMQNELVKKCLFGTAINI